MGKKRSPKGVSNRRGRAARAWRLGAVILAAGESRRMGSPKPLLRLGERTFLECVIEGAQAANPERIVVVTSEGLLNDLAALGLRGVTITINPHPERGMAESLRCGLRLLDALPDAVLVALADHPHVRPDSVAALARAAKRHHGKIILPVHD